MKRIKIIDVPRYETDPKEIVDHLTEFLKKIRKDKVATDLIGDDDRSVEFEVSAKNLVKVPRASASSVTYSTFSESGESSPTSSTISSI
ncbi:MAG: hypothetical protein ABJO29_09995 [Yoonia sp.]|uniref:hypothetical protein n=1 Tax=Yoonia sp. TaxID=2212373 RepID=UPI0032660735